MSDHLETERSKMLCSRAHCCVGWQCILTGWLLIEILDPWLGHTNSVMHIALTSHNHRRVYLNVLYPSQLMYLCTLEYTCKLRRIWVHRNNLSMERGGRVTSSWYFWSIHVHIHIHIRTVHFVPEACIIGEYFIPMFNQWHSLLSWFSSWNVSIFRMFQKLRKI